MASSESPFSSVDRLIADVDKTLKPGNDFTLGPKGITVAHCGVYDTALAACLVTLGIPPRNSAPFTDDVGLNARGNETGRRKMWWLGSGDPTGTYKTEEIAAAWTDRAAFEAANPLHPLNAMRAAIDARTWWIDVLQAWKAKRAIFPIETTVPAYETDSLHGASVLKACGFTPLAFNRGGFSLSPKHGRVAAHSILLEAAQAEGSTPPMWMSRVLHNLSTFLRYIREETTIIRQEFDAGTSLILSVDAPAKTRDQFLRMI